MQPDNEWRTYVLTLPDSGLSIWVGERNDIRGETVSRIVLGTIVPDLVGIPLMLLLVWAAIGSGLKPLDRLAQQIRSRDPDSLVPITEPDLPQEVAPMQAAINRLLFQVKQLLAREQRFIADAAHELRTPLAVMKVHLDNARNEISAEQKDESLEQLQQAVERTTRLVSQMLELARLSDSAVANKVALNVPEETRSALSAIMPLALQKHQSLEVEAPTHGLCNQLFEPGAFKTLLQNLVGNAITHTTEGTRIIVSIKVHGENWCLCVDDSGAGVSDEDRELLVERFFSSGDTHGTGLGLSIAKRIVERHQGNLTLGISYLGGLQVRVCFPLHEFHEIDVKSRQTLPAKNRGSK